MANFPIHQKIPIKVLAADACQGSSSCDVAGAETFIRSKINQQQVKIDGEGHEIREIDEFIDLYEADDFVRESQFGYILPKDSLELKVFKAIQRKFYGGSAFDGAHATFNPLTIFLERKVDGDTCVTNSAVINGQRVPMKISFRLDGGDTPESFRGMMKKGKWEPNPKLETFKNYIWLLWKMKFRFGDNINQITALANAILAAGSDGARLDRIWKEMLRVQDSDDWLIQRMIEDRIVYFGLIAGFINKSLVELSKNTPFTLEPSFSRSEANPATCNTLDLIDFYNRNLGRLRVGPPTKGDDYFAAFIATQLPTIMETHGREIYNFFHDGTQPATDPDGWSRFDVTALTSQGKALLQTMKSSPKGGAIWQAISPDTLPKPWEVFSKERSLQLALEWSELTKKWPQYKNDVMALVIFLGLAWTYPKYRNQYTDYYLRAEDIAMRCPHPNGPASQPHGLWNESIFQLMQPNPKTSELFFRFKAALSRGKEFLPEDCCIKLTREGKDIYRHCSQ